MKYISHPNPIGAQYITFKMRDLWVNVVIIMFLCFSFGKWQNPVSCGKSGIMSMKTYIRRLHTHTHTHTQRRKKKPLSVSNIPFSRSKGRGPVFLAVICLTSGSIVGQCQVEQRSRIPPAYPELNATPSIREACHQQSRWSMHASQWFLLREEGGGEEKCEKKKKVKADGFDFIYISCSVQ